MSVEGFLRGVQRFVVGVMILKLAVVGAFVMVGPWWALRGGLAGAAALIAGIGLLFDWRALDVLISWLPRRGRRVVLRLAVAWHLAALSAGVWIMTRPIDPAWELVEGTASWSDPRLVQGTDGALVALTGSPRGARRLGAAGWEELGGPDLFAWEFHAGPDGSLWSAPPGIDRIDVLEAGSDRWRAIGRGGQTLDALAVGAEELLAAVDGAAYRYDLALGTWSRIDAVTGFIRSVALAPDGGGQALALGLRWWERQGGVWREVPAPEGGGFPDAFVGAGGWRYAITGGVWSGALYVARPGEGFAEVAMPVSDLRVVVTDPRDGGRVIAGSWGQGVWDSRDGGRTWSELGLQQIQVRSMAVDWGRGRVCVGSSNLTLHGGVFCRTLPGHSSGALLLGPRS